MLTRMRNVLIISELHFPIRNIMLTRANQSAVPAEKKFIENQPVTY
jgi:hypothetical protein